MSSPTELPLEALMPSSENPRRAIDPASIEGLVSSIREHGIIQPLVVRPLPGTTARYEIIAGHRRYAAAHYRQLVTEAQQRARTGAKAPTVLTPVPKRGRPAQDTPVPPAKVRDALVSRLRAADRLLEQLRREDAADPELRVLVLQHRGILDRVMGVTPAREEAEVPA